MCDMFPGEGNPAVHLDCIGCRSGKGIGTGETGEETPGRGIVGSVIGFFCCLSCSGNRRFHFQRQIGGPFDVVSRGCLGVLVDVDPIASHQALQRLVSILGRARSTRTERSQP